MPADYYSKEEDTNSNEAQDTKPEDSKEETALIPKSLTGDRECKPGEKLTVEVVKVYDDELEIKVIGYNDKKPKPDEEESDMDMEDSMSKLDRMAMMSEEE